MIEFCDDVNYILQYYSKPYVYVEPEFKWALKSSKHNQAYFSYNWTSQGFINQDTLIKQLKFYLKTLCQNTHESSYVT